MKKNIPLLILFLLLVSCATTQKAYEPTVFKSSAAKIQYYEEQIARYQYLIDQEKKKAEIKAIK
jgi:hypothetical protein